MANLANGHSSTGVSSPPCVPVVDSSPPSPNASQQELSVVEAFSGATVLITGVTGFVGSVTLELLLRACPDVRKVILLIRSKPRLSGEERLDHLLHGKQLFRSHWGEDGKVLASTRAKLQVVEGDISREGCGLSAADTSLIRTDVTCIIHSAASISFFEHIHTQLDQNFWATKHVADLAKGIPGLPSFVHVSTAYVNACLPKGSHVEEALYPLRKSSRDAEWEHLSRASEMSALPPAKAERRARALLAESGMPNNYTLTKHFAERLLDDANARGELKVVIVRPSIIGGVARAPVPGYCGNTAGFVSAMLAFATGMARFVCHDPRNIYDVVPCDVCASAILLAAAGRQQLPLGPSSKTLIMHVASGTTNPASYAEQFEHIILPYWQADPPRQRLKHKAYKSIWAKNSYLSEDSFTFKRLRLRQGLRLRAIALALRLTGNARVADRILSGWKVWKLYNTSTMDFNLLFSCATVQRLQALLPAQERALIKPLWRAPEDDWEEYLVICMDTIRAKYFPSRKADTKAVTAAASVRALQDNLTATNGQVAKPVT